MKEEKSKIWRKKVKRVSQCVVGRRFEHPPRLQRSRTTPVSFCNYRLSLREISRLNSYESYVHTSSSARMLSGWPPALNWSQMLSIRCPSYHRKWPGCKNSSFVFILKGSVDTTFRSRFDNVALKASCCIKGKMSKQYMGTMFKEEDNAKCRK